MSAGAGGCLPMGGVIGGIKIAWSVGVGCSAVLKLEQVAGFSQSWGCTPDVYIYLVRLDTI